MTKGLVLLEKEVRSRLPMTNAINVVRQAYMTFAKRRVVTHSVVHLGVERYNAEVDIKTG
jgi:ornithine cyclodeaminase/alanine dehydrogenase-like protein (mu-crystallin family)